MENPKKKESINKWKEKGLDWCAEQLWKSKVHDTNATEERDRLRCRCEKLEDKYRDLEHVLELRRRAEEVLTDNEIGTTQLIVHWKEPECEFCGNCCADRLEDTKLTFVMGGQFWYREGKYGRDRHTAYCDGLACINRENNSRIATISFYSFEIDENLSALIGLNTALEEICLHVTKVVDAKTGETIFERKD